MIRGEARVPVPGWYSRDAASLACPLCGGENVGVLLAGEDPQLRLAAIGSSRTDVSPGRVLRCRACGFGYRQLRPRAEELAELYRDLDGAVYEADRAGRTRTARRHLAIVERFAAPSRLLDVGCASGQFLHCAAERGWEVVGVEPSGALSASARQAINGRGTVICAPLEEARLPPASFDAVTLWDVLEHVSDPAAFLRCASGLLKPGGFLFANVPDLDSLQARVFGRRWPLFLQEHLGYFNRSSLLLCGQRAGVDLVRFGRRPACFSLGYVLYRMAQHGIPGAALGHSLVRRLRVARLLVFLPLGELYAVWRRPLAG